MVEDDATIADFVSKGLAGFGQSLAHEVGNRRIVFDHKHSHDTASVRHTPST